MKRIFNMIVGVMLTIGLGVSQAAAVAPSRPLQLNGVFDSNSGNLVGLVPSDIPGAQVTPVMTAPRIQAIRAAISAATVANPIDAPVVAAQPTITTLYNSALTQVFPCDPALPATQTALNLYGGNWFKDTVNNRYIPIVDTVDAGRLGYAQYEFATDAPLVQMRMSATVAYIAVNGQQINKSGVATSVGGGQQQLLLDWSADPAGARRARTYQVVLNAAVYCYSTSIDPQSRMWAPNKDNVRRWYFEGDSYIAGTLGNPGLLQFSNSLTFLAATRLGAKDIWIGAVGGTGYLAVGTTTTLRQRISNVCAASPDIVIVGSGANDLGFSPDLIQAEVTTYFKQLRACLGSQVPVIVFGPWPENRGPNAATLAIEPAIAAGIAANNDSMTVFVQVATDPAGAWIFGTGYDNNGTPTGSATGNSILYTGADQAHPNLLGQAYYGYRISEAVKLAIKQIPSAN